MSETQTAPAKGYWERLAGRPFGTIATAEHYIMEVVQELRDTDTIPNLNVVSRKSMAQRLEEAYANLTAKEVQ
jgi:hypothetical protein